MDRRHSDGLDPINTSEITRSDRVMSTTSEDSPSLGPGMASPVRQMHLMGVGFCLLFTGFNVAQNMATSRKGDTGSNALGILYCTFTFSNLVASAVVNRIRTKAGLVFGAATYCAFVAANIYFARTLVYSFSALIGIGAAVIWTAQGAYTAECVAFQKAVWPSSGDVKGKFNGVFWAWFQMAQVLGNAGAALLFQFDIALWVIFLIFTGVCAVGVIIFCFLRQLPRAGDDTEGYKGVQLLAAVKLLVTPAYLALVPISIYSGFSQGFIYGDFPPLIIERDWKFYTMTVFGATDVLTSYLAGRISDKVGRLPLLLFGMCTTLFLYMSIQLNVFDILGGQVRWKYMLIAILMGVGDGIFNTQLYALITTMFKDQSEEAFANFKFLQSASITLVFFFRSDTTLHMRSMVYWISMVIGVLVIHAVQSTRDAAMAWGKYRVDTNFAIVHQRDPLLDKF